MARIKIDINELLQLVKKNYTVSEIARELNVGKAAVSKRLKDLRLSANKDVALRSAPQLVDRSLKAMDQLIKINELINRELDHIEGEIQDTTGAERQPLQDQRLKHVAEVRKQLALLLDLELATYNVTQVKEFQDALLDFLDQVEPGTRERFLRHLAEKRMIGTMISLPGGISKARNDGII